MRAAGILGTGLKVSRIIDVVMLGRMELLASRTLWRAERPAETGSRHRVGPIAAKGIDPLVATIGGENMRGGPTGTFGELDYFHDMWRP